MSFAACASSRPCSHQQVAGKDDALPAMLGQSLLGQKVGALA
jgi:hypothetical protein